jgi:HAD superfamily hydrolase (TIGR01493 family)
MSNARLIGVKACVFDAYGTLFDFAAAAKGCRDVLGESIDKLTALWREKQLQYTWLRALKAGTRISGRSPPMLSISHWKRWQSTSQDCAIA